MRLPKLFDLLIILPLLIFLILYLFWERYLIMQIVFVILSIFSVYQYFLREKSEWLVLLSIYFIVNVLFNLLANNLLPIWVIVVILIISICFLFYTFTKDFVEKLESRLFYSLMMTIVILEIYVSLLPWPINIESKSLIVLSIGYVFWGVLYHKFTDNLRIKQIFPYLLSSLAIIGLIILSASWIGY